MNMNKQVSLGYMQADHVSERGEDEGEGWLIVTTDRMIVNVA